MIPKINRHQEVITTYEVDGTTHDAPESAVQKALTLWLERYGQRIFLEDVARIMIKDRKQIRVLFDMLDGIDQGIDKKEEENEKKPATASPASARHHHHPPSVRSAPRAGETWISIHDCSKRVFIKDVSWSKMFQTHVVKYESIRDNLLKPHERFHHMFGSGTVECFTSQFVRFDPSRHGGSSSSCFETIFSFKA